MKAPIYSYKALEAYLKNYDGRFYRSVCGYYVVDVDCDEHWFENHHQVFAWARDYFQNKSPLNSFA